MINRSENDPDLLNRVITGDECGPGSSSGKVLGYGLNDPGSIPGVGGGGDFSSLLCVQTGSEVHSASYKMSTGSFPRGKGGRA